MRGEVQLVAFRLPVALVKRVDRYAAKMRVEGKPANRSDALRYFTEQMLAHDDWARPRGSGPDRRASQRRKKTATLVAAERRKQEQRIKKRRKR